MLATSTLIKIFVKMLKFSQNTFSKELNFVKENKESIRILTNAPFSSMESSDLIN
jgi:hypothetical protein